MCSLNQVKSHRAAVLTKERDLAARESSIAQRENNVQALLSQKESEISTLRSSLATTQASLNSLQAAFDTTLAERVRHRENELRALVAAQEAEVAARMARREEEIMAAVRTREEDITRMWAEWETKTRAAMGAAVEERMEWVRGQASEVDAERTRLEDVKRELERRMAEVERAEKEKERRGARAAMVGKTPLEEVKNILAPLAQFAETPVRPGPSRAPSTFETPRPAVLMKTPSFPEDIAPPSAMKGVILTATGEPVATPSPAELAKLFVDTPKVGLNFAKIFDFDSEDEEDDEEDQSDDDDEPAPGEDGYETDTRPSSGRSSSGSSGSREEDDNERTPQPSPTIVRPTRLRRPSIRASGRPSLEALAPVPAAATTARRRSSGAASTASTARTVRSSSRPPSSASSAAPTRPAKSSTGPAAVAASQAVADYDLSDEENLPSPFLKKRDRQALMRTATQVTTSTVAMRAPRKSGATLRQMTLVHAAAAASGKTAAEKEKVRAVRPSVRTASLGALGGAANGGVRPSIAKAMKASEDAKKALSRS